MLDETVIPSWAGASLSLSMFCQRTVKGWEVRSQRQSKTSCPSEGYAAEFSKPECVRN
jgi:hypothetical protein